MFTDFVNGVSSGDPIALLIVAAAILAIYAASSPIRAARRQAEIQDLKAKEAEAVLRQASADQMRRFAVNDMPLSIVSEAALETHRTSEQIRLNDANLSGNVQFHTHQTTEQIRLAKAQSEIAAVQKQSEADIHIKTVVSEDDAALRAARLQDELLEERRARFEKRRREDSVPSPDGEESGSGSETPGDPSAHDKAPERFRKPKPPDPAPGA